MPAVARSDADPVFYYDLGDAECYLAAERLTGTLPVVARWQPVLGVELTGPGGVELTGPGGVELTGPGGVLGTELTPDPHRAPEWRADIERRAIAQGLLPIRWPARWPPDSRAAMHAACYAAQIGRAVAFSLASFRQAFAAGRDLGDVDTVLIAAAACELHPSAILRALELRTVREGLAAATAAARAAGVSELPALRVGEAVLCGPDAVERAAAALAR